MASFAEVRSALTLALNARLHEHQTQVLSAAIAFNEGAQSHITRIVAISGRYPERLMRSRRCQSVDSALKNVRLHS